MIMFRSSYVWCLCLTSTQYTQLSWYPGGSGHDKQHVGVEEGVTVTEHELSLWEIRAGFTDSVALDLANSIHLWISHQQHSPFTIPYTRYFSLLETVFTLQFPSLLLLYAP